MNEHNDIMAQNEPPEQKPLQVWYAPDLDILHLSDEQPASNGRDVAKDLMVFADNDDEPRIVTLERAAKVLLPYLCQDQHHG